MTQSCEALRGWVKLGRQPLMIRRWDRSRITYLRYSI